MSTAEPEIGKLEYPGVLYIESDLKGQLEPRQGDCRDLRVLHTGISPHRTAVVKVGMD